MKKALLLLMALTFHFCGLFAKSKVIVNPSYEVKSSGITNVIKIELSDTATRLTLHNTFIPGWWIDFSKKEMIKDSETGKTYQVTGIEGAEFGEKIVMPASGDSTIVLIFPPLENSVKKIDYNTSIYGISLNKNDAENKSKSIVPNEVAKWLKSELAKVPRSTPIDFHSEQFLNTKIGRLVGYIKGYDIRLGFTTGIIYANNSISREDFPIVIHIHPDGRFEANIPMISPMYTNLTINDKWLPFYLEPGQTLSMILDWEEFLKADRLRNIRYKFKNIVYQGPLTKVNNDLAGFSSKQFNYNEFLVKVKTLTPEKFKQDQKGELKANREKVEHYIKNNTLTPQASAILSNQVLLEHATHMFDFVSRRKYLSRKDTTNKTLRIPAPISYYDFLKQIPLNDKSLLATNEFSAFVNRLEYCTPLFSVDRRNSCRIIPEKTFMVYLQEEGVSITADEKELLELLNKKEKTSEEIALLKGKKEQLIAFNTKYKKEQAAYKLKYIVPVQNAAWLKATIDNWKDKDSILINKLGLKPDFVYEVIKVRSLKFQFKHFKQEAANTLWDNLKKGISNTFVIETGDRIFNDAFPGEDKKAYELPKGFATDIFRKIIDPFKGKILFVDFWATSCGPCVGGIKTMKPIREKYKNNPDFDFIFITNKRESPEGRYNKFVEEQGMKNTFRLSKDEYNYLRQLFKFNGIPRYVVIDKQGKILNDNFAMWNFEWELPRLLSGK